jgi:hypothetical protein
MAPQSRIHNEFPRQNHKCTPSKQARACKSSILCNPILAPSGPSSRATHVPPPPPLKHQWRCPANIGPCPIKERHPCPRLRQPTYSGLGHSAAERLRTREKHPPVHSKRTQPQQADAASACEPPHKLTLILQPHGGPATLAVHTHSPAHPARGCGSLQLRCRSQALALAAAVLPANSRPAGRRPYRWRSTQPCIKARGGHAGTPNGGALAAALLLHPAPVRCRVAGSRTDPLLQLLAGSSPISQASSLAGREQLGPDGGGLGGALGPACKGVRASESAHLVKQRGWRSAAGRSPSSKLQNATSVGEKVRYRSAQKSRLSY